MCPVVLCFNFFLALSAKDILEQQHHDLLQTIK
jgi:hypothetical protein